MHPWLNWIEHLTTDQKVVGSNPTGCTMKNICILIISVIFLFSCSIVVNKVANIRDIKEVTGEFAIGTKRFQIIDSTRKSWYLDGYDGYRTLMLQVWYPSDVNVYDIRSSYIDNEKAFTYTLKNQGYGVPSMLTDQIGSIKCNSWDSSKPLKNNKFPIVIFSHGHGGLRTQNTNQVEELVSHGFIVMAVDHTYDAGFVEFLNGNIEYSLTSRPDSSPIIESPEEFNTRFFYRINDINFLINQINSFHILDNEIFSIMDTSSIGIFGHSLGGLTSIYAALNNKSIKSCYALDALFESVPDSILNRDFKKPIFHIGQNNKGDTQYWEDSNFDNLKTFLNNNSNYSIMIDIPGSYHYDYTDFTYFTYLTKRMNFSGEISTDDMVNIMNETLLDFLNASLKNYNFIDPTIYKTKYPMIDLIIKN